MQQKLQKQDSVILNKVIIEVNIECAFSNVEISLRIFLALMFTNRKHILSNEAYKKIQTEQRWDKRGWNPDLCSWLKQFVAPN